MIDLYESDALAWSEQQAALLRQAMVYLLEL